MQELGRALSLLGLVFLLLGLFFNLMHHLPRIPGDIYIERPGIRIYIPFVSAIVISILLSLIFNIFRR